MKLLKYKLAIFLTAVSLSVSTNASTFDFNQELADQGVATAQSNLGVLYTSGQGVRQDYTKALYWYTKAANQGVHIAQYNLGVMYSQGQGVRQDYTKALYWYIKAANQGYAKAQFNLGVMYLQGQGVRQNYATAKEWFGKSCDNGYQDGCNAYKKLNLNGY